MFNYKLPGCLLGLLTSLQTEKEVLECLFVI